MSEPRDAAPVVAGGGLGPVPAHVAIIMDGNGRWAKRRGLPRVAGHRRGADSVRAVIEAAVEQGVRHLTLFGFSSENWRRPAEEVSDLMGLLRHYLRAELAELHRNGIRMRVVGERERLATDIAALITTGEETTRENTRLDLTIALSYGGRAEIVAAARRLVADVLDGTLRPSDIDEERLAARLWSAGTPDPDLLIRTSGEKRVSNFLLWQCAYTEFVFVDTLWPDFGKQEFADAISEFRRRERRFGSARS
jgi:undecaprenyl diphosphate synthase